MLEQTLRIIDDQIDHYPNRESLIEWLTEEFSQSPVGVFLKDHDENYVFVNNAFETYVGMPANDVLGKSDFDFMRLDDARRCAESDILAVEKMGELYESSELEKDANGKVVASITVYKKAFATSFGNVLFGIFKRDEE
ncbi:MAG: hypothetical protein CL811_03165 [Colwelliaceae bacterium]|nr:hypothetical protein [Colwelliaceae bacterium]|tara:strand:+ start:237 stop:650 length:414 start_codon:yes stop_codon:yes gene_type:complete